MHNALSSSLKKSHPKRKDTLTVPSNLWLCILWSIYKLGWIIDFKGKVIYIYINIFPCIFMFSHPCICFCFAWFKSHVIKIIRVFWVPHFTTRTNSVKGIMYDEYKSVCFTKLFVLLKCIPFQMLLLLCMHWKLKKAKYLLHLAL